MANHPKTPAERLATAQARASYHSEQIAALLTHPASADQAERLRRHRAALSTCRWRIRRLTGEPPRGRPTKPLASRLATSTKRTAWHGRQLQALAFELDALPLDSPQRTEIRDRIRHHKAGRRAARWRTRQLMALIWRPGYTPPASWS